MNTSSRITLALIAIFGATALMFAQAEIAPTQELIQLERVVITGKRTQPEVQLAQHIEQLPRVVIHGRSAQADLQLAQACAAQALC